MVPAYHSQDFVEQAYQKLCPSAFLGFLELNMISPFKKSIQESLPMVKYNMEVYFRAWLKHLSVQKSLASTFKHSGTPNYKVTLT